ncbi:MAG: nitroreductase/quinone reductase family protein [Acidimicrobiia bacterium]
MAGSPTISDPEIRDAEYAYLTTTGRVSSRPHTVELWFALGGDALWFFTEGATDWLRNAEHTPAVRVRVGAWSWDALARIEHSGAHSEAGTEARTEMLRKYAATYSEPLDNWAASANGLGAVILTPPHPTTETWPLP